MKITLDTNVLVSATFWTGDSFRILKLIDEKKMNLVLSLPIIEEYHKILDSNEIIKKIKNKELLVSKLINTVLNNCELVKPRKKLEVVKDDPEDDKILECAQEGKVDYIITQDNHLLKLKMFENIIILAPFDFLGMMRKT